MLLHQFGDVGPLVAVADPMKLDALVGAPRWRVEDTAWKDFVLKQHERAGLVIVSMAATSGLRWEIETLVGAKALDKSVFMFPPENTCDSTLLRTLSQLIGHWLPDSLITQEGTELHVLAVVCAAGRPPAVLTSSRVTQLEYYVALRSAISLRDTRTQHYQKAAARRAAAAATWMRSARMVGVAALALSGWAQGESLIPRSLLTSVAVALFVVGAWFFHRGGRLQLVPWRVQLALCQRPPVLFVTCFEGGGTTRSNWLTRALTTAKTYVGVKHDDEHLRASTNECEPIVAIDSRSQDVLGVVTSRIARVVVRAANTEAFWSFMDQAIHTLHPERLVCLLPFQKGDYERFCDRLEGMLLRRPPEVQGQQVDSVFRQTPADDSILRFGLEPCRAAAAEAWAPPSTRLVEYSAVNPGCLVHGGCYSWAVILRKRQVPRGVCDAAQCGGAHSVSKG